MKLLRFFYLVSLLSAVNASIEKKNSSGKKQSSKTVASIDDEKEQHWDNEVIEPQAESTMHEALSRTLGQCAYTSSSEILNTTVLLNFKGNPDTLEDDIVMLSDSFISAYDDLGSDVCYEVLDVVIDTSEEVIEEENYPIGSDFRCGIDAIDSMNNCGNLCTYPTDCAAGLYCFGTWNTCYARDKNKQTLQQHRVLNGTTTRYLQSAPFTFTFDFTLFVFVTFQCTRCPSGSNLLSDDASRRILSEQTNKTIPSTTTHHIKYKPSKLSLQTEMYQRRMLQQEGLCNADNPENCKGPKRDRFLVRYNEIFHSMRDPLQAVEDILDVAEVQKHPCDLSVTTMDTYLEVTFLGDYSYLERRESNYEEIKIVEHAIKRAYNNLNMANSETCDLLFRRVHRAKFVKATRLIDDSFSMAFDIEYECRGIDIFESLFHKEDDSDDPGRHNFNMDFRESGPVEPECTCAIGATIFRAPTNQEFSHALGKMVKVRCKQDRLNFVTGVVGYGDALTGDAPDIDVVDQGMYNKMLEYPSDLQKWMFGSNDVLFPLYPIPDGWKNRQLGELTILSPSDNSKTATVYIEKVLKSWKEIKAEYYGDLRTKPVRKFMKAKKYNAFVIIGSAEGQGVVTEKLFVGLIVRFTDDTTGSRVSTLIPLRDYSIEDTSTADIVGQYSCADTFAGQAFQNTAASCNSDDGIIQVRRGCIRNFSSKLLSLDSAVNADLDNSFIPKSMAYSYANCTKRFYGKGGPESMIKISRCMQKMYQNSLIEYVNTVAVQTSVNDKSFFNEICQETEKEATEDCFSCTKCSVDLQRVNCCQDSDCAGDDICANHSCFPNGNLRFTLTWEGNDDLDLHVVSASTGIDIYSGHTTENAINPSAGGQFDTRFPNSAQGRGEIVDYFAEHIWFPECVSQYEYFVTQVTKPGGNTSDDNDDKWTLNVYQDNKQIAVHTGQGSSREEFRHVC